MPITGTYIQETDLQNALGPSTYLAIYDDTNSGSANTTAVDQTITRAHAKVVGRLINIFGSSTLPPTVGQGTVPALLYDAELNYAIAISWERHPEYVRNFGEKELALAAYMRAEKTMDDVQASVERLPEFAPAPANVGGATIDDSSRIITTNADGTSNAGDF